MSIIVAITNNRTEVIARIINQEKESDSDYPWLAAIKNDFSMGGPTRPVDNPATCTGSLVSKMYD